MKCNNDQLIYCLLDNKWKHPKPKTTIIQIETRNPEEEMINNDDQY